MGLESLGVGTSSSSINTNSNINNNNNNNETDVVLNVYDLTPFNNYVSWVGFGIFHSGLEGSFCSCLLPESLQVTTVKQLPEYNPYAEDDASGSLSSNSPREQTESDDSKKDNTSGTGEVAFIKEVPSVLGANSTFSSSSLLAAAINF